MPQGWPPGLSIPADWHLRQPLLLPAAGPLILAEHIKENILLTQQPRIILANLGGDTIEYHPTAKDEPIQAPLTAGALQHKPAGTLTIILWNVNGLNDSKKKNEIAQILHARRGDIMVLSDVRWAYTGSTLEGIATRLTHWKGFKMRATLCQDTRPGGVVLLTSSAGEDALAPGIPIWAPEQARALCVPFLAGAVLHAPALGYLPYDGQEPAGPGEPDPVAACYGPQGWVHRYLRWCQAKRARSGLGGDLNADPYRARGEVDGHLAGLVHTHRWQNVFLKVGTTFPPGPSAIDALWLENHTISITRPVDVLKMLPLWQHRKQGDRVSDHCLLQATLHTHAVPDILETQRLRYSNNALRRIQHDPTQIAELRHRVAFRRRCRLQGPSYLDLGLADDAPSRPHVGLDDAHDVTLGLIEMGTLARLHPREADRERRGQTEESASLQWATATTSPFSTTHQDLNVSYRLRAAILKKSGVTPTYSWTSSARLVCGEALAAYWAECLNARFQALPMDWLGLRMHATLVMPEPPKPRNLRVLLPAYSVFYEAAQRRFNKKCASGPDLLTNLHLILMEDQQFQHLYQELTALML
eukprot:gene5927-3221_t